MFPLDVLVFGCAAALAQPPAEPPAAPPNRPVPALLLPPTQPAAILIDHGYAARYQHAIEAAQPTGTNMWSVLVVNAGITAGFSSWLREHDPSIQSALLNDHLDELQLGSILENPAAAPATAAKLRAFFDDLPELKFDWLDEIAAARRFVPPPPGDDQLVVQLMPELGSFRSTARLLSERLWYLAEKHDEPGQREYARTFAGGLAIARAAACRGQIISTLVSMSINSLLVYNVENQLLNGRLTADTRRQVLKALDEQQPISDDLTLQTERIAAEALIEQSYDQVPAAAAAQAGLASREESLTFCDECIETFGRCLSPDPAIALPARSRLDALYAATSAPKDADLKHALAYSLIPAYHQTYPIMLRSNADREGLRLMLALSVYHDLHHSYPDTLAALVPEILPTLPHDPALPDHSFGYRRIDPSADPLHREYLLYSVGLDGVDNQGVTDENNNNAYFATDFALHAGVDYVINWIAPHPAARKPANKTDHPPDAPKP